MVYLLAGEEKGIKKGHVGRGGGSFSLLFRRPKLAREHSGIPLHFHSTYNRSCWDRVCKVKDCDNHQSLVCCSLIECAMGDHILLECRA